MILPIYEVSCDYCGRTINHYLLKRPSCDDLKSDGYVATRTKQFCSEKCYADWNHDRQSKKYSNLRQNGRFLNK